MNFISALWTTFIQGSPHAAVDLKLASAYLYKVGGRSHGIAGLASITRKDTLALSTQRMERTSFGADFGYLPRTYVFPQQRAAFASETSSQARPPLSVSQWITKPSNDSCGANITVHSGSESALSSGEIGGGREGGRGGGDDGSDCVVLIAFRRKVIASRLLSV